MNYGSFIQTVFDFVIVAFAIFPAIKLMNKCAASRKKPGSAASTTAEEKLLTEIRDLLSQQQQPKL